MKTVAILNQKVPAFDWGQFKANQLNSLVNAWVLSGLQIKKRLEDSSLCYLEARNILSGIRNTFEKWNFKAIVFLTYSGNGFGFDIIFDSINRNNLFHLFTLIDSWSFDLEFKYVENRIVISVFRK